MFVNYGEAERVAGSTSAFSVMSLYYIRFGIRLEEEVLDLSGNDISALGVRSFAPIQIID